MRDAGPTSPVERGGPLLTEEAMLPWLSRRSRITRLAAGSITPSASPMAANRSSPRPSPLASQRHLLAEVGGGMPAIAAMLVLVLALVPRSSSAIGLRWISGSSDLTFSSALRCTLVVAAESGEQRLPPTWRLTWVAQGCSIEPVAIDPVSACLGDLAQVTAVLPPATPADSAAHTTTALLCSAPTSTASGAFFLLDLPAGASGKLKAAALDTTGLT